MFNDFACHYCESQDGGPHGLWTLPRGQRDSHCPISFSFSVFLTLIKLQHSTLLLNLTENCVHQLWAHYIWIYACIHGTIVHLEITRASISQEPCNRWRIRRNSLANWCNTSLTKRSCLVRTHGEKEEGRERENVLKSRLKYHIAIFSTGKLRCKLEIPVKWESHLTETKILQETLFISRFQVLQLKALRGATEGGVRHKR